MLRNKIVVVVGGISPVTSAVSLAASKHDAIVIIISSASKEAAETLQQLKNEKREASYYYCDISVEADLRAIVSSVIQKYKRIDVLYHVSDFLEERWDRVLHLKAVMFATKAAMPFMIKQHYGKIILVTSLISSASSLLPGRGSEPTQYNMCKVGILSFVRAAAMDLAQYNIAVNAIEGGLLTTSPPLPGLDNKAEAFVPMGRLGKPEEVAVPAVFMGSDGASFITGQWLNVTGGLGLANSGSPSGSAAPSPSSNSIENKSPSPPFAHTHHGGNSNGGYSSGGSNGNGHHGGGNGNGNGGYSSGGNGGGYSSSASGGGSNGSQNDHGVSPPSSQPPDLKRQRSDSTEAVTSAPLQHHS